MHTYRNIIGILHCFPNHSVTLLVIHPFFKFSVSPPPSILVFLPGWCFPLPTVMLICAVIKREGLNTAF